ncbi:MAG: uracil-DNA glycosylase [Treponema sp. RIFOXYC1_FULL_61_9]|nr:MAG: uracil-DNA glycosylase [Treponema sp. RIFOXYC1_FULL_61_9]
MTAEEKRAFSDLLDLAEDVAGDGYRTERPEREFSDDVAVAATPAAVTPAADSMDAIAGEVRVCTACPLASTRKYAVPGEGVGQPLVLVIGEGPGADEDASGRPFVGPAGQLLDRMLQAVGLSRETNCFIANLVKCRPPKNRDPEEGERLACAPYLDRQIALLAPRLILSVGRVPTQALLGTTEGIGRLRGRFVPYRGIPLLPTYHPSALLRDEELKRPAWEDMKLLRSRLESGDEDYARSMAGR